MRRKNRIIGQFAILLLAVGLTGWWIYQVHKDVVAPVPQVTLPKDVVAVAEAVEVPPAELKNQLRSALQGLERLPKQGVRLAEVDATLILTPEEIAPEALAEALAEDDREIQDAPPRLSLLFFNHQRFVVLNGRPYQEGGVLEDGRIIRVIDQDGVTLECPITAEMERIYWIAPLRVELKTPPAAR
jgi:hypothetical protein